MQEIFHYRQMASTIPTFLKYSTELVHVLCVKKDRKFYPKLSNYYCGL